MVLKLRLTTSTVRGPATPSMVPAARSRATAAAGSETRGPNVVQIPARSARIEQPLHTPAPPRPLLARAAINPATIVPWWYVNGLVGSASSSTASQPGDHVRSGWAVWPVSIAAKRTDGEPIVTSHASGTCTWP